MHSKFRLSDSGYISAIAVELAAEIAKIGGLAAKVFTCNSQSTN